MRPVTVVIPGHAEDRFDLLARLVPPEHNHFGYFVNRCYQEGRGTVELARLHHGGNGPASLRRTLPQAVRHDLVDSARGRGVARAGAALVGGAAVAAGAFRPAVTRGPCSPPPKPGSGCARSVPRGPCSPTPKPGSGCARSVTAR